MLIEAGYPWYSCRQAAIDAEVQDDPIDTCRQAFGSIKYLNSVLTSIPPRKSFYKNNSNIICYSCTLIIFKTIRRCLQRTHVHTLLSHVYVYTDVVFMKAVIAYTYIAVQLHMWQLNILLLSYH